MTESFDRGDHYINPDLETDPDLYKTVVTGDQERVMGYIKRGSRLSISVNMANLNIYIGEDHRSMQERYNIQFENLVAGYAKLDRSTNEIKIEDFTDWRKGADDSAAVKRCIGERLTKDLSSKL